MAKVISMAERQMLAKMPPEVRQILEATRRAAQARETDVVQAIRIYLRDELGSNEIAVTARGLRRMTDQVLAMALRQVANATKQASAALMRRHGRRA